MNTTFKRDFIGVGRFRTLGGQGLEFWGAKGGQIPSRHMTSFRRHVPTRFLINQCQIITFLIVKSDIMENLRIELRGIVLPVPSNQIKVAFIIILPFNLVHLWFLFHIEIEGKGGWIIGGAKGYVGPPPPKLLGGAWPLLAPPPRPTPMDLTSQEWTHLLGAIRETWLLTGFWFNPLYTGGLFHSYMLDKSICHLSILGVSFYSISDGKSW